MNSPTEERWKKLNVDRSWAEESWTAGWTSFRRMAIEKSRIFQVGESHRSSSKRVARGDVACDCFHKPGNRFTWQSALS